MGSPGARFLDLIGLIHFNIGVLQTIIRNSGKARRNVGESAVPFPSEKAIRGALLARAHEFSRLTGMSAADIGKRAINDPAFLYQVEEGRNFTILTYRRFMAWLDKRWPADDVPMPASRLVNGKPHRRARKRKASK